MFVFVCLGYVDTFCDITSVALRYQFSGTLGSKSCSIANNLKKLFLLSVSSHFSVKKINNECSQRQKKKETEKKKKKKGEKEKEHTFRWKHGSLEVD